MDANSDYNGPDAVRPDTKIDGGIRTIFLGCGTIGYGVYSYTARSSALQFPDRIKATVVSASVEKRSTNGVSYGT